MTEETYDRRAFLDLIWCREDGTPRLHDQSPLIHAAASMLTIDDAGVRAETGMWRPALELPDLTGIDLRTVKDLPFPFTARQLAAFFVDGAGALVQEHYGPWASGPNEGLLAGFDIEANRAVAAIRGAYAAYTEAEQVVDPLDAAARKHCDELSRAERPFYEKFLLKSQLVDPQRKDDVVLRSVKLAKAALEKAQAASREARVLAEELHAKWRMAMVRHLLVQLPEGETSTGSVTPNAVAPPPNKPVGPAPIKTSDIAFCFDGLDQKSELAWKKALGKKPKWLSHSVEVSGARGGPETQWNPVFIGVALVTKRAATARQVRARFQNRPQLQPWLDTWKTYEADLFEAP